MAVVDGPVRVTRVLQVWSFCRNEVASGHFFMPCVSFFAGLARI